MKTRTAFLIRFLLPPFYGTVGCILMNRGLQTHRISEFVTLLGFIAVYAYVFAGLPALAFALLLGRFARRRPAFGGRLMWAVLLGLASGALITAMFDLSGFLFFVPLGGAVGFAVEGTVVLLDRRNTIAA
jgi:hypothetical protein